MESATSQRMRERIIQYVRKNTCLYDTLHEHHNVRSITDVLWDKLGAEIGISGPKAKSLWRNLKDSYRVQKKKQMRHGSNIKKWYFFDKMHFMDKFIEVPSANGNFSTFKMEYADEPDVADSRSGMDDDPHEEASDHMGVLQEITGAVDDFNSDNPTNSVFTPPVSKRRRVQDSTITAPEIKTEWSIDSTYSLASPSANNFTHEEKSFSTYHPGIRHNPGYSSVPVIHSDPRYESLPRSDPRYESLPRSDPEEIYGAHVASTLRALTARQRQLAKMKIEELFYKIQFPDERESGHVTSGHVASARVVSGRPEEATVPTALYKNCQSNSDHSQHSAVGDETQSCSSS